MRAESGWKSVCPKTYRPSRTAAMDGLTSRHVSERADDAVMREY